MNWLKVDYNSWLGLQELRVPSCTGTLIAPDTILTAAHCLDVELLNLEDAQLLDSEFHITFESDLSVYAEYPATPFPDDSIKVRKIVPHPDFDIQTLQGVDGPGDHADIGLIFLEKPVTNVEPAIVITPVEASQIKIHTPVKIAGWGMRQPEQTSPNRNNSSSISGIKHCADSEINELGEKEFQIGSDTHSSRKCHGDSGGPSYMDVVTTSVRYERVIGITSHSYDFSDCYKGGVDTRVDVWYDWIDKQMKEHCADGTRPWCEVTGIIPPEYYDPPKVVEESGCSSLGGPSALLLIAFGPLLRKRLRRATD